jgi:protease-4
MFGGSGKFSESERQVMKEFMEDIYGQFTRKAADGRNMPLEQLQSLAEGRIYTGRQAKRNGLVDELGTLDDAIDSAKQLAGLDKDDKVRIQVLPEPVNLFESMFGDLDSEEEVRLPTGMEQLVPELAAPLRQAHLLRRLCQEPAMLLMPFEIQME